MFTNCDLCNNSLLQDPMSVIVWRRSTERAVHACVRLALWPVVELVLMSMSVTIRRYAQALIRYTFDFSCHSILLYS